MIVYTESNCEYKGLLCEVSSAIALGLKVIQCGEDRSKDYEIFQHPDLLHGYNLKHAFSVACYLDSGKQLYNLCENLPEELFI